MTRSYLHFNEGTNTKPPSHAIRLLASLVVTATLALGIFHVALADSGGGCPKQCCSPAAACGGETGNPPGPLSICSPEQAGQPCNGCDGTAQVRVCANCVQDRKCTAKAGNPTVCGNPFTGICTKAALKYFYCKKTQAGGQHSCNVSNECTGDAACP